VSGIPKGPFVPLSLTTYSLYHCRDRGLQELSLEGCKDQTGCFRKSSSRLFCMFVRQHYHAGSRATKTLMRKTRSKSSGGCTRCACGE
jgi:hypothetical protein